MSIVNTGLSRKFKKYNNVKTGDCPSFKHHIRKIVLKRMEETCEIANLQREVPFDLVVNDVYVCKYIADFVYLKDGHVVVEDVKGRLSAEYVLKRKLMFAVHGIKILET